MKEGKKNLRFCKSTVVSLHLNHQKHPKVSTNKTYSKWSSIQHRFDARTDQGFDHNDRHNRQELYHQFLALRSQFSGAFFRWKGKGLFCSIGFAMLGMFPQKKNKHNIHVRGMIWWCCGILRPNMFSLCVCFWGVRSDNQNQQKRKNDCW